MKSILSFLKESGYNDAMTTEERVAFFQKLAQEFSVIPLRDGFPEAGEDSGAYKAPVIKNWQQYCYEKNPNPPTSKHRVGWTTGVWNQLLILDIDDEKKFNAWQLETKRPLPKTFTVKTGKGKHRVYRRPIDGKRYGNRSFKKRGYDIRGDDGYCQALGSLHPNGSQYTVDEYAEIADAPEWLLAEAAREDIPKPMPKQQELAVIPACFPFPQTDSLFAQVPVGMRSDEEFREITSLMRKGFTDDQIIMICETLPLGDKARERGPEWLRGELARARSFLAANDNPPKAPKKKSVDTMKELLGVLYSLEYFCFEKTSFYAKDASGTNVTYLNITSDEFFGYVNDTFYTRTGLVAGIQNYKSALAQLKYRLKKNGAKSIDKITRFGVSGKNLILDLGLDNNDCIEITRDGYAKVPQPEMLLERNENIQPLEVALEASGLKNFYALLDILHVENEFDRIYMLITAVSWLFENVSTPSLFFIGKEGSGKSFLAKSIKGIFDPAKSGTVLNKKTDDLILFLNKSGIGFIDNFHEINAEAQNNFCLAFTDGTYTKRMNYEDSKTCSFQLKCPMIFCSLYIFAKMNRDFITRTAFFTVTRPERIEAEEDLLKKVNKLYPAVRGELCNLASKVLDIKDDFSATSQKRHGDFDKIGQAVCEIVYKDQRFYKEVIDYRIKADNTAIIQNDAVVNTFVKLMKKKGILYFTMSELKTELTDLSDDLAVSGTYPNHLSNKLHKYQGFFESIGIYLFDGTKLSNSTVNGHIYMSCTENYIKSGKLPVDIDTLRDNPSIVTELYMNQKKILNDYLVNDLLESKL